VVCACLVGPGIAGANQIAPASTNPDLSQVESELRNIKLMLSPSGKFRQAPPLSPASVKLLENAIAADPGNAQAHLLLARYYERLGIIALSNEQYALAVDSLGSAAAVRAAADREMAKGNIWYAGRIADAALKRYPDDVSLLALAAVTAHKRNRLSRAKTLYQSVLARAPERVGVRSQLAQILMSENRYQEATELALWDLRRDPQNLLAHNVVAQTLMASGNYERAIPYARFVFDKMPLVPDSTRNYAFLCYWQGDYKSALKPSLISIALAPDSSRAPSWIVDVVRHATTKQLRQEIQQTSTIVSGAKTYKNMAIALDQADLHTMAIEQWKNALIKDPSDSQSLSFLANDLESYTMNREEALQCYEKAHARAPRDPNITANIRRLQQQMEWRSNDVAGQLRDWLCEMFSH
jgi:tetratricopeptide (TPR) repeat protein